MVAGRLGKEQLDWLAKILDKHADKPALLMMHHNPEIDSHKNGLKDTKELFEVIKDKKHVKGLFFGHTHNWNQKTHHDIHLVNLPPVAYVFQKGKPSGWVDCHVTDDAMELTLHSLDESHEQHLEKLKLSWRS